MIEFTENYLGTPYTYENSSNPYIMDNKNLPKDIIKTKEGIPITAQYLWTLNKTERIECLEYIFNYLRNLGFPYIEMSEEEISKEINKIKKDDFSRVLREDNLISNNINVGLNICQIIAKEEYYNSKGEGSRPSLMEVFNDDKSLIKVLKNRMGWNTSKEDGTVRPYMFQMTHNQILNGIRNSGLGAPISNFRPSIAKYFYDRYLSDIKGYMPTIFDYSCGWGARALASIGKYNYIGTDPLTANKINQWFKKYLPDENIKCLQQGSEIYIPEIENKIDMCFSCPPYFTLEKYSEDESQSYIKNANYNDWINEYWKDTVNNCYKYTKENGYFILVIKDKHENYNLRDDMCKIIDEIGFKFIDIFLIKNSRNHLSGKAKSKITTKNNESVIVFQK